MMFKVLPLIKSGIKTGIKSGLVGVMLCGMLTTVTHATATKLKYDKNGRLQTVPQDKSVLNQSRAYCENMIASVWANKSEIHLPPIIVLKVFVQIGEERKMKPYRFINLAQDKLTSLHDLAQMELGCLTNNGGVGLSIPHTGSDELSLRIQADENGRIFFGYDQIGLELMEPHCPTSERMKKFKKFCEGSGLPIKN